MYTGTCIPLKKKLFITAEYQLMPCEKISFNNNYGLICNNGNIQNINHKYIAEQYNKNIKTVISQCKKCYYSMLCSFCIFTLQNKGDGYYCNRHMTIRRFSIYLSKNQITLTFFNPSLICSQNAVLYSPILQKIFLFFLILVRDFFVSDFFVPFLV